MSETREEREILPGAPGQPASPVSPLRPGGPGGPGMPSWPLLPSSPASPLHPVGKFMMMVVKTGACTPHELTLGFLSALMTWNHPKWMTSAYDLYQATRETEVLKGVAN